MVRAIVAFAEEAGPRHHDAEGKPVAVGKCQAGWALLMAAAIRPVAFGPRMVAGGRFDGAWRVTGFENSKPANTCRTKQYEVWAEVERAAERYLGFET